MCHEELESYKISLKFGAFFLRQNPANVQLRLSTRNFSWARAISGRRKANIALVQSARFQKKCNLARGRTPPQLQITHLRILDCWAQDTQSSSSDRPGLIFTFRREINRLLRLGARPYLIMRGAGSRPACMLGMGASAGGGSQQSGDGGGGGGGRPASGPLPHSGARANSVRESFCINGGAICGSARGTLAAQAIRLMRCVCVCADSDRRLKCSSALRCGLPFLSLSTIHLQ